MNSTADIPLIGQTVRLWPYQRGLYARDVLWHVWKMIEEAKATDQLFWGVHDAPEIKGDLTACIQFFEAPGRHLVMISNLDNTEMVGCAWFDDLVPKYRCFGSVFMKPAHRGKTAEEAIKLASNYAFAALDVEQLWGVTPWRVALYACLRCGFERIATLPGFTIINGERTDAYIVRKVRASDGQYIPQGL